MIRVLHVCSYATASLMVAEAKRQRLQMQEGGAKPWAKPAVNLSEKTSGSGATLLPQAVFVLSDTLSVQSSEYQVNLRACAYNSRGQQLAPATGSSNAVTLSAELTV